MAASRIRGITVEISGDTTKQQTALKSIYSEIKNTQSQLKDIEKLRDKAREMSAKTKFSASEAADAMNHMQHASDGYQQMLHALHSRR